MKRRAMFGQWKTPPQVLYPSSGSGMKKSTSMPTFNSLPPEYGHPPEGMDPVEASLHHQHGMRMPGADSLPLTSEEEGDEGMGTMPHGQLPMSQRGDFSGDGLKFTSPNAHPYPVGQHHVQYDQQGVQPHLQQQQQLNTNVPKRAMSYQDFGVGWSDEEPTTGSSARFGLLGAKRSAQAIEKGTYPEGDSHPSQYVNPRHSLLQGSSPPSQIPPSSSSLLGYQQSSSKPTQRADKEREAEERRLSKLARNRASARMRRMKKKTLADSLEVEVEELQRSILFLRSLQEYQVRRGFAIPTFLGYPRDTLSGAFESSQQPCQVPEDQEMEGEIERTTISTKISPEDQEALSNRIREQLSHLDLEDLRRMLMEHLVGGTSEEASVHTIRRSVAVQYFQDHETSWTELLRLTGAENNALFVLLTGQFQLSDRQLRSLQTRQNVTRKTRVQGRDELSHVPVSLPSMDGSRPAQVIHQHKSRYGPDGYAIGLDAFPCNDMYKNPPVNSDRMQLRSKLEILRQDLLQTLNLSDQQRLQIHQLGYGLQKEQLCCHAFLRIVQVMMQNGLLDLPHIDQIADNFRGVLGKQQMDKFITWSKRNLDAIEALDIAPPESQQV